MPTYIYRREDGTTFESFQRITDDALTEDPETGQKVERVISGGAGLQFKGSGFYLTDYARSGSGEGSNNGEAKSETSSDTESETAAETKSEAKPDSKGAEASGNSTDE